MLDGVATTLKSMPDEAVTTAQPTTSPLVGTVVTTPAGVVTIKPFSQLHSIYFQDQHSKRWRFRFTQQYYTLMTCTMIMTSRTRTISNTKLICTITKTIKRRSLQSTSNDSSESMYQHVPICNDDPQNNPNRRECINMSQHVTKHQKGSANVPTQEA